MAWFYQVSFEAIEPTSLTNNAINSLQWTCLFCQFIKIALLESLQTLYTSTTISASWGAYNPFGTPTIGAADPQFIDHIAGYIRDVLQTTASITTAAVTRTATSAAAYALATISTIPTVEQAQCYPALARYSGGAWSPPHGVVPVQQEVLEWMLFREEQQRHTILRLYQRILSLGAILFLVAGFLVAVLVRFTRIQRRTASTLETLGTTQTTLLQDLATATAAMRNDLGQTTSDLAAIKTDVTGLTTDTAIIHSNVTGLATDTAAIKTDVAQNKTDFAGLAKDTATIRTDVEQNKADMASFKADIATNADIIVDLNEQLRFIKADINDDVSYQALQAGLNKLRADLEAEYKHIEGKLQNQTDLPKHVQEHADVLKALQGDLGILKTQVMCKKNVEPFHPQEEKAEQVEREAEESQAEEKYAEEVEQQEGQSEASDDGEEDTDDEEPSFIVDDTIQPPALELEVEDEEYHHLKDIPEHTSIANWKGVEETAITDGFTFLSAVKQPPFVPETEDDLDFAPMGHGEDDAELPAPTSEVPHPLEELSMPERRDGSDGQEHESKGLGQSPAQGDIDTVDDEAAQKLNRELAHQRQKKANQVQQERMVVQARALELEEKLEREKAALAVKTAAREFGLSKKRTNVEEISGDSKVDDEQIIPKVPQQKEEHDEKGPAAEQKDAEVVEEGSGEQLQQHPPQTTDQGPSTPNQHEAEPVEEDEREERESKGVVPALPSFNQVGSDSNQQAGKGLIDSKFAIEESSSPRTTHDAKGKCLDDFKHALKEQSNTRTMQDNHGKSLDDSIFATTKHSNTGVRPSRRRQKASGKPKLPAWLQKVQDEGGFKG